MEKFRTEKNQKQYLWIVLIIFGVFYFMKFLSPILSPFIVAFLIAGALDRLTDKIPIKMKKSFLASILLLLFVSVLVIAVWAVGSRLLEGCSEFAGNMPLYEEELCMLLSDCCDRMEVRFGVDGTAVEDFVLRQVNVFAENMEVNVFPAIMNKSVGYMKNIAGIVSFLIVTVIAVFLILKDYDSVAFYLQSNENIAPVYEIGKKVLYYIKTYLKAQIIILLLISIVSALTLVFLRVEGGLLIGIFTGFMDMLPFIGTGIMLMPVAFFQFLNGNYTRAVVILILYGVCALLREFLEPKLIGNKVGIWPVAILFAVFAGIKLFGISGIIKGPIGLVIIWESCRTLFEKIKTDEEDCVKMTNE